MKQIFLFTAVLLSLTASAQIDTSKVTITLTLKQKHIAYMGAELSKANTLADQPVRDSMIKYIGSGTLPDSIMTTKFKAGVVLKFIQAAFRDQSGTVYSMVNELATSTQAQGWAGLINQLNTKKGQAGPEQGVSIWLYDEIMDWFNRHQGVYLEKITQGRNWLLTPIIDN